jgi:hypothetical protein
LPSKDYYQLEFRSGKGFGPNAFALPGGLIVITDDMVKAASTTEEVMAVLAHEIGHVELRHTLRSVLQQSVIGVAVATLTSDAASLGVAVAGLPMLVARTKYSREFEAAADKYAFQLLKQKGYSPADFASLMERLEKHTKQPGIFAFISSHPVTSERIQHAIAAAGPLPPALQNGVVDEVKSPLSLSWEDKRSLLVGAWFGDQPTEKGGRHMWINHRSNDGTYKSHSRLIDASGKREDTIALGDWSVEGDIFSSIRTGVLKGDKVVAADPANPHKRYDYRILNLTGEMFECQRVDSNAKMTSRRVPADFDFCAGRGEYSVFREGFTQEFSMSMKQGGETTKGRLEVVEGPKTTLNGVEVFTSINTLRKASGDPLSDKTFYLENDQGVKEIARQGPKDGSPVGAEHDDWTLRYPLIAGATWAMTREVHGLAEKVSVPAGCVIQTMDDVVTVPAGTFERCMKIKLSYRGKVSLEAYGATPEVTLEEYAWYAPGIGYVKGSYTMKCSNPALGGVELHTELISYKN